MTKKIEQLLVDEARKCDNCLCWLDHCEAECCYHFSFRLNPLSDVVYSQDVVRIRIRINPDLRNYFDLHGVKMENDVVVIPRDRCSISPHRIFVTMRCIALQENLLCQLQLKGKPDYCKNLTWETAQKEGYEITPRCLFSYKMKALSGYDTGNKDCSS